MAHQALYREWRPRIFDEVVEQKHVVYALRQTVISGQIGHAYLFSGTRGTGKTTLAKIFARAINCIEPQGGNPCNCCPICTGMLDGSLLDIIEMDAASNNSVDNIRRICDEVVFMPSQARFKVYIIDEVHMLSTGAFNALLKTLEEPPPHAVFILATTEPHRIPATILSRCQRYEFRRIPVESLVGRLAEIARADAIGADEEALRTMAMLADGALRDAISLLDQAKASFPGHIGRDDVLSLAGVVQDEFMQQLAAALLDADAPMLLNLIDQLVMAGRDLARFVTDLAQNFRNILVCKITDNPSQLVRASSESLAAMKRLAQRTDSGQLIVMIKGLSALLGDLRWAADTRTALEIGLIRLMGDQSANKKELPSASARTMADKQIEPVVKPAAPVREPLAASVGPAGDRDPGPEPPPDEEVQIEESQNIIVLWQNTLNKIMNDGHMTLYLFCRPATPAWNENRLELRFAASDQVNFQEASKDVSLRILRQAFASTAGRDALVCPVLNDKFKPEPSSQPESSFANGSEWIQKIKNAADTLGIPVKMEE